MPLCDKCIRLGVIQNNIMFFCPSHVDGYVTLLRNEPWTNEIHEIWIEGEFSHIDWVRDDVRHIYHKAAILAVRRGLLDKVLADDFLG
jgi:hypothetical protein